MANRKYWFQPHRGTDSLISYWLMRLLGGSCAGILNPSGGYTARRKSGGHSFNLQKSRYPPDFQISGEYQPDGFTNFGPCCISCISCAWRNSTCRTVSFRQIQSRANTKLIVAPFIIFYRHWNLTDSAFSDKLSAFSGVFPMFSWPYSEKGPKNTRKKGKLFREKAESF